MSDALCLDDAPEFRHHIGIAEAPGRGNDQCGASAEPREACAEGAADMKQRQRDQEPLAWLKIEGKHRSDC